MAIEFCKQRGRGGREWMGGRGEGGGGKNLQDNCEPAKREC